MTKIMVICVITSMWLLKESIFLFYWLEDYTNDGTNIENESKYENTTAGKESVKETLEEWMILFFSMGLSIKIECLTRQKTKPIIYKL